MGDGVRAAMVGRTVGVAIGTAAALRAAVAVGTGVADAFGVCAGVGFDVGSADGFDVALGVGFGFDAPGDGVAVDCGGTVACATVATGAGVCVTTSGVLLCAGAGTCRAANAESSAPIPNPAMMTPAKSGTIGKPPRSSSSLEERRRRGELDRGLMSSQRSTREGLALDGRTRGEANRDCA